jgi:hypothetical protein
MFLPVRFPRENGIDYCVSHVANGSIVSFQHIEKKRWIRKQDDAARKKMASKVRVGGYFQSIQFVE